MDNVKNVTDFLTFMFGKFGLTPVVVTVMCLGAISAGAFFLYKFISSKFKKSEPEPEYSKDIKFLIKVQGENLKTLLQQIATSQISSLTPEQVDTIVDNLYHKAIILDIITIVEMLCKTYKEEPSNDLKKEIEDILVSIVMEYDDVGNSLPKSFSDSLIDLQLRIESIKPLIPEIEGWVKNETLFTVINAKLKTKMKQIVIKWKKR
jgi:hypothetical protein